MVKMGEDISELQAEMNRLKGEMAIVMETLAILVSEEIRDIEVEEELTTDERWYNYLGEKKRKLKAILEVLMG